MCPAFVFLVALWISAFNLNYMVLGEDSSEVLPSPTLCLNCTVCQHPCHPLSPPSQLSGYPSYGAPPPPPSFSGYPSYGAPPPPPSLSTYPAYGAPPPPSRPVQANCPPVPIQCCQYPSHPNPYEYEPLDDHSPTPYSPLSSFSIVTLLLSFAVLF
ncbi:hypothetical protein CRYUN_Cryun11dG0009200 [Craigia yunnanensis]